MIVVHLNEISHVTSRQLPRWVPRNDAVGSIHGRLSRSRVIRRPGTHLLQHTRERFAALVDDVVAATHVTTDRQLGNPFHVEGTAALDRPQGGEVVSGLLLGVQPDAQVRPRIRTQAAHLHDRLPLLPSVQDRSEHQDVIAAIHHVPARRRDIVNVHDLAVRGLLGRLHGALGAVVGVVVDGPSEALVEEERDEHAEDGLARSVMPRHNERRQHKGSIWCAHPADERAQSVGVAISPVDVLDVGAGP
mmetsp:Transcript_28807/g.81265  ORF Transcript_28807/g.81265 Transcript_28807/m.81265 type:complete len:247 (-) Transcript_28807:1172-1912(-)